jgi:hypothetical protein
MYSALTERKKPKIINNNYNKIFNNSYYKNNKSPF